MSTRITHPLSRALARLLRIAVALVITAIVLITAAQQFGRFGPWWLELSRYVPYPAVLAPAAIVLLLSFRFGRAWVLASAAALALVLTLGMGLVWGRPDPAREGDTPVRLMTYNSKAYLAVQRRDGFAKLAAEVALQRPEILVMQDAYGARGALLDLPTTLGPGSDLSHVYAAGQYVVASRFALRDCAQGRIDYRGEDHRYVRCVVDVNGVATTLVTAHFESPRLGLNAARREGLDGVDEWRQNYEDRLGQAKALARDLAGSARPLIVAGDLNAPESSPVIRSLLAIGLRDAFSSAGRGYGYSYGQALRVGFSFLRIDHILLSPEVGVARCFAGNGEASEHRPVIADLLLRRP